MTHFPNSRTKTIFGAPGCGKTRKLMEILSDELKQTTPDKIAFVSFTRKGAYEGRDRAMKEFGYSEDDFPFFKTLHSIAFNQGGFHQRDIIKKYDYKRLSNALNMKFVGYYTADFTGDDDKYIFYDILERNNPKLSDKYLLSLDKVMLKTVQHNYKRYKKEYRVVDFTDIIETFVKNDQPLPVKIAIIDEAQDLTYLQWRMCEVAFRNCERVYIAGDDDQAIYEWSGADVGYFLDIEGEKEILTKSYRLQKKILNLSKIITASIAYRQEKDFDPINDEGNIFFHNTMQTVPIVEDESYYFLSRNNYFLYTFRHELRDKGLLFWDKDNLSIDERHIKAINNFETLRKKPHVNYIPPSTKMFLKSQTSLQKPWYENFNLSNDLILYYRDMIRLGTKFKDQNPNKMVNTIHGVKGGEADNVVIQMDITKSVRANCEVNLDSELRCLYVGVTRAKKNLHIVFSNTKHSYEDYINLRG